jgi:cobalt-zinc-cadmium efflux system outer membrane protein
VLGVAAARYWEWVGSGHQLTVASNLLALAEARDRDLADAVALGAIAPVERLENQRSILQRRSALVAARRALERQALALSLYVRMPDGTPRMPVPAELPSQMLVLHPPPDETTIAADTARAVDTRPDVRALLVSRQQQDVVLELARNEGLPTFDLFAEVSRDNGNGSPALRGTEVDAGASFQLPLQRRQARGQTRAALAARARTDAEVRLARDRIRTEIEDAVSAWRAAAATVDLVRQELDAARALEQAERDRFTLGDSTQFLVNLRELGTADAAFREVAAVAESLKASISYEVAVGRLTVTRP